MGMYEVASKAVKTEAFLLEVVALPGLILDVGLLVGQQLLQAVGEFAPEAVGTPPCFRELSAELCFFLLFFRIVKRESVREGPWRVVGCSSAPVDRSLYP
jgi:hypothetical protein